LTLKAVIHIGGNKTGSTTLQRGLFAAERRIRYLGEDCDGYAELRPLLESLVQDDESFFDAAATAAMFAQRFGGEGGWARVYSNEDIMTSRLASVSAQRLKKLMPDATVVMVMRNQLTAWPSWYANHGAFLTWVPRRYWRRPVALEEWLDFCFAFPKRTPVEALNYFRFFRMFADLFGADQVNVMFYEELLENPARYYARWDELLGLPAGEAFKALHGKAERRRNSARRLAYDHWKAKATAVVPGFAALESGLMKRAPTLARWIDGGVAARIELPVAWKTRIRDYYASTNSQLAELVGLDMARYGYPLTR
jgi:Sulfotransferase domain